LWEVGTQAERIAQVEELLTEIREHAGDITDRYIGTSFTALRVTGTGVTFQWLLTLPTVRMVDSPPDLDEQVEHLLETIVFEIGEVAPPAADAPAIAIIDSGINEAHPVLANLVVETAGFPATLGVNDGRGSRNEGQWHSCLRRCSRLYRTAGLHTARPSLQRQSRQ
jgi:hypothetical protein